MFDDARRHCVVAERAAQRFEHFGDQRRRRDRLVVAHRTAGVEEPEPVARGEQCFEKGVAILVAADAVAGLRPPCREVEARRATLPRVRAVVEPEQHHDPRRHGAPRAQRRERDAMTEKGAAARALLRRGEPFAHHDRERHAGIRVRAARMLLDSRQRTAQRHQRRGLVLVGLEERAEHAVEPLAPVADAARPLQFVGQREHGVGVGLEPAGERGGAALRGVERQHAGMQVHAVAGDGVAEQQALQAGTPGVIVGGRKIERRAARRIAAPAHAGVAQPLAQRIQIPAPDAEAASDRRAFERRDDRLGVHAASGEREQPAQHAGDLARRHAAVGDAERNAPPLRRGGEHRLDAWRVGLDVGDEHQHVAGIEPRLAFEEIEQPVVQHLHLAHRSVADVQRERRHRRARRHRRSPRGRGCRPGGARASCARPGAT